MAVRANRRRWVYLAVLITVFVVLLITQFNFTAIGHFSAIFIGLPADPTTAGYFRVALT